MKLTEKEEKIARLALDPGAKDGERAAAANKLIESLYARGVRVEDIVKEEIQTEYVYSDPSPPPRPQRRDTAWDPDPEVRRRRYEEADAEGYRWDRQYGNGYSEYSAPEPTPEEVAAKEEADRQYQAECARREREEAARVAEAQARERARQAVLAARPWYTKMASATGALLGPYSKQSGFRGWTGDLALEEKINTGFGFILLFLIALLPVIGIAALLYYYPIACLTILLVGVAGFYCYYVTRRND